jgi:type II secretory pathway pseudopilin PulG
LIELLVVLAIMALLASLLTAAFGSIKNASGVTSSAYIIAGALERGRAYAMAHNTYVWVGFYEDAAGSTSYSGATPPYTGVGRVVIGLAASKDGTDIIDSDGVQPGTNLSAYTVQIEKLIQLQNVDLCTDAQVQQHEVSGTPLQLEEQAISSQISSTSEIVSSSPTLSTSSPITIDSYTFYDTVRFSPTGEGVVDDGTTLSPLNVINLRPTHGANADQNSVNVATILFTGIGGNVHVYRN